jgi:hypothetical protein
MMAGPDNHRLPMLYTMDGLGHRRLTYLTYDNPTLSRRRLGTASSGRRALYL